jgi:thiamine kinase-like enzyme
MYKEKICSRIQKFSNTKLDLISEVNGVKVRPIAEMLNSINWELIYEKAIPSTFHGDFQPENIIYDGTQFKLIDWRASFGSSLEIGDLYYDLGKLYHALLINGNYVLEKKYSYKITNEKATIHYDIKSNLLFLLNYFESFCKNNCLCWENTKLLGILQYIGISALYENFHEGEYGEFLFLLGKYLLAKHYKETN